MEHRVAMRYSAPNILEKTMKSKTLNISLAVVLLALSSLSLAQDHNAGGISGGDLGGVVVPIQSDREIEVDTLKNAAETCNRRVLDKFYKMAFPNCASTDGATKKSSNLDGYEDDNTYSKVGSGLYYHFKDPQVDGCPHNISAGIVDGHFAMSFSNYGPDHDYPLYMQLTTRGYVLKPGAQPVDGEYRMEDYIEEDELLNAFAPSYRFDTVIVDPETDMFGNTIGGRSVARDLSLRYYYDPETSTPMRELPFHNRQSRRQTSVTFDVDSYRNCLLSEIQAN